MKYLAAQIETVEGSLPFRMAGTVQGIAGLTIEASDLPLPLGSLCRIQSFGGRTSSAEVVGFRQNRTLLMPLTPIGGVSRGDRIESSSSAGRIDCSSHLLGRVLDGFGRPIDGKEPLRLGETRRIDSAAPAPRSIGATSVNRFQPAFAASMDCIHVGLASGWGFSPGRASARAC